MTFEAIILAAGEGVRMRSSLPKTLHTVGGKAMLAHVIDAVDALAPVKIHVVIGSHAEQVKTTLETWFAHDDALLGKLNWVTQAKRLGTGHAALQAMSAVDDATTALFLYGDTPLIRAETLQPLLAAAKPKQIALLTAPMQNPTGLGRILRDAKDNVIGIVEEKDASATEKQIRECNTGFIAARADVLANELAKLDNDNAQKEFYLTDVIGHAVASGVKIVTLQPDAVEETLGVNSHAELAWVERAYQLGQAQRLLNHGVRMHDPARFDVRGRCEFGRDCVVDVNVILEGEVVVGDECEIGANVIVRNSRIGAGCVIESNCVIEDAVIGARCKIGPFARLRPQTRLDDEVRVGNFVEIKNSHIGKGSKANHLSYVGDSDVGKNVNIGAGVITCNYDGANKHRSVIGDDVFVGSNCELVAPIAVGAGATIGAGSTITEDVPAKALAVARNKQRNIERWRRPVKK